MKLKILKLDQNKLEGEFQLDFHRSDSKLPLLCLCQVPKVGRPTRQIIPGAVEFMSKFLSPASVTLGEFRGLRNLSGGAVLSKQRKTPG
jgi:hypothetical protein